MPISPATMALANVIARARERHARRHGDNEWSLCLNLVPRVQSAASWEEAEYRTRGYVRRMRKRFHWVIEDEAVTVMRESVWPSVVFTSDPHVHRHRSVRERFIALWKGLFR